ncbi:MAG TPA: GxGYxYP domain-containing protein, partial [Limnochordia bacterium]
LRTMRDGRGRPARRSLRWSAVVAAAALWLGAVRAGDAAAPAGNSAAPATTESTAGAADRPVRLFLAGPAPAETLIVLDLSAFPPDLARMFVSLQGIVNQGRPRLYLLTGGFDRMWAEWLVTRGDTHRLVVREPVQAFELIREFRSELQGQVVIDPALPATINVATMLSGLDRLLITHPRFAALYAERYHLPIVVDLRGRFRSSAEAYRWAWEELWPRLNHHALAILHPDISHLRDVLIQQKIFVWWQSGLVDGREPGNNMMPELEVTHAILRGAPVNIPVLGYPWHGDGVGLGEGPGVTLFSRYGKFLIPTDWAANLSVHSRARPPAGPLNPPPSPAGAAATLDETKAYISLIVSDGDNLQAWLNYFPRYWQARGTVPVGWTIGPAALDLMPDVIDYLRQHRTDGDYFLAAVSGIGYAYLDHYGEALADPDGALDGFFSLTASYMERLGLNMIWPMVSGGPVPRPLLVRYAEGIPFLSALFPDYGQKVPSYRAAHSLLQIGGRRVAVFHALGSGQARTGAELQRLLAAAPRPAFAHAFVLNWNHPDTAELARAVAAVGDDAVALRPDALVALYTAWAAGPDAPAESEAAAEGDAPPG